MTRRSLTVAFLGTLIGLGGCSRPINRAAERKIRDALPSYLGPAKSWQAHVENAPERTARGQLKRVIIEGDGVVLRQSLSLERLHIEMEDVDFDSKRAKLNAVGKTTFAAIISEVGLNDYLRRNSRPDDESVRIQRV